MLLRRQCPTALDTEEATTWLAPVPTATPAGTPRKISSGRHDETAANPEHPERKPMASPMLTISATLRESSATGR